MISRFAFAAAALGLTASCQMGPPTSAPGLTVADYEKILADPGRSVKLDGFQATDQSDDAARKPAEVMAFADIRKGDTVLELEAGRGWMSHMIYAAVGPTGKLIIQYPPEFAYGDAAFKTRQAAGQLTNATIIRTHFDALDAVASKSVDRVLWVLGPHELYFVPPNTTGLGEDEKTYKEIMRVLKPGGLFIAMDHAANPGAPTSIAQTLHRIDPSIVMSTAQATGFEYVGKSTILANPADDRTKRVFEPDLRRHTDQFLFKFRRPWQ